MDLENIMLSEIIQRTNTIWSHLHVTANVHTELTSKTETESGRTAVGVEGLSKIEKELMDMDNSVVIVGGGEWR